MKKTILILLLCTVLLCQLFVGCKKNNDADSTDASSQAAASGSTAPSASQAPASESVTLPEIVPDTQAPTETRPVDTEAPQTEPLTEAADTEPVTEPAETEPLTEPIDTEPLTEPIETEETVPAETEPDYGDYPPVDAEGLKEALDRELEDLRSSWQIAVMDPINGTLITTSANCREDDWMKVGEDAMGVYLMGTVFGLVADGLTDRDAVLDDVTAVIQEGDQAAATRLLELMGSGVAMNGRTKVRAFAKDNGVEVGFNPSVEAPNNPQSHMVAADNALLLSKLYNGELISSEVSQEMLELLFSAKEGNCLDYDFTETGSSCGFVDSEVEGESLSTMGVVMLGSGRPFAVSVLCEYPVTPTSSRFLALRLIGIAEAYFEAADNGTPVRSPEGTDESVYHLDLRREDITFFNKGENFSLYASSSVLPENIIVWESSDPEVAVVDSDGKVTALSSGTVTITATCRGITAKCIVRCKIEAGFDLNRTDITLFSAGEQFTLKPVTEGLEEVTTWTSSDETVVVVDADGTVTAVGPGTATVTAQNGELTATCIIRCRIEEEEP